MKCRPMPDILYSNLVFTLLVATPVSALTLFRVYKERF